MAKGVLGGGLDRDALEQYLADEEFSKVFGMPREEFDDEPEWKKLILRQERGLVTEKGTNVPLDNPPYFVVRKSQLRTAHFDAATKAESIARKRQQDANPTLKLRLEAEEAETKAASGISRAELRKWNIYKWKKRIEEEDFDDGTEGGLGLGVVAEEDDAGGAQNGDVGDEGGVEEGGDREEEELGAMEEEEWVERQDEYGNVYYESLITGVTQWEKPEQPQQEKKERKKEKDKKKQKRHTDGIEGRGERVQGMPKKKDLNDLQLAIDMNKMIKTMTDTEKAEFDIPVVPRPLARVLRSLVKIGAISNRRDADIRILFNKPVAVEEVCGNGKT